MNHNPLYRDFIVSKRKNGDNLLWHHLCEYSSSTEGDTLAHLVEMAEKHIAECRAITEDGQGHDD